jgi:hypothetical protein
MKLVIFSTVVVLAIGGCARPSEEEGVATAAGISATQSADPDRPSENPQERVRQFVACMRANGVDVPDPESDDRTGKTALRFDDAITAAEKAEIVAAMEKCNKYFPSGGENIRLTPEHVESARRFGQCMRDNGVPAWPDPDADGNFKTDSLTAVRKDDPAVQAALEKCRAA